MIGVFNYTTWLTYVSLMSGVIGIIVSLHGSGHPFIGVFFLCFSGLCDTFDGIVARTKKDRTEYQKKYGIQIDSLADLVAFGVLPACIGFALLHVNDAWTDVPYMYPHAIKTGEFRWYPLLFFISVSFYVLAAVVRLAHFNVVEELRQQETTEKRKTYTGLPVTSAALIFPAVLLLHYFFSIDLTIVYFFVLVGVGVLFIGRFQITKPDKRGLKFLLLLGAIECALLILFKLNVFG